jgi:CheY-like chemotaxis protein
MPPTIRVLLVEDNPRDAALAEELLARSSAAFFEVERAGRMAEALDRL